MASDVNLNTRTDVDCKQNEATCNKKHNPKYKHSYTKHQTYFNVIIFRGTRPTTCYKIN